MPKKVSGTTLPNAVNTDLTYDQLTPLLKLFDTLFPGAKEVAEFAAIIADGVITNAEIDAQLARLPMLYNAAMEDAHLNDAGQTAETAHRWTVDAVQRLFDGTQAFLYLLRALPDDARITPREAQDEA